MYLPIDTRAAENNLISRATCYSRAYGYYTCRTSAWYRWGRWVVAGLLILIGLLFLFVCLCITKRRRRRNQINSTNQPMAYQAPASNNYSTPQNQYAPPPGAPPHGGANADYYAGGNGNYGVTQPQNTYAK